MRLLHRTVPVIAIGAIILTPTSVSAGGGVGGGGSPVGGGQAFTPAASIQVDHAPPPGHNYAFLDFYPRTAVVHQGDTVTFTMAASKSEPHTMTLVPAGTQFTEQAVGRLFPNVGTPAPGPASGSGVLATTFNVDVATGCGASGYFPGTRPCSYTGKNILNSGLFFAPGSSVARNLNFPAFTYSVSMNAAPGTYRYLCLFHGPQMSGTIRVVAPTTAIPSPSQNATAADAQYRTSVANAEQHEARLHAPPPTQVAPAKGSKAPPTSSYQVLTDVSYGRVAGNEFLPSQLTIKAGDSVTWLLMGFHTVTFPPNSGVKAVGAACQHTDSDSPFAGTFAGCTNLELLVYAAGGASPCGFTSGRPCPTGIASNSGVLLLPKQPAWTLTFSQPGTYTYECLIHVGMKGTITVTR